MRKLDSDFIFEREVYDLLTNGILKDTVDLERDRAMKNSVTLTNPKKIILKLWPADSTSTLVIPQSLKF